MWEVGIIIGESFGGRKNYRGLVWEVGRITGESCGR